MTAVFLFWTSAALLFHSYLLYPVLLRLITLNKKPNDDLFPFDESPRVTILMAVYNEEEVIAGKIDSIFSCGYPPEKLQLVIGSDASTDRTDELVGAAAARYEGIELVRFEKRTGKVMIINELVSRARHDVLVLTDANVMLGHDAIYQMARHFRNGAIGLVDSRMNSRGLRKEGISVQEKTYISTEVNIKHMEGLWGCMIGPFGGCYAIRKSCFSPVPSNFLVDDFYINMRVLEHGYRCINEKKANVYEDVSHSVKEEFRRKVRIATGNYQNLSTFRHLLFRFNPTAFCFASHKAIRWFGPLLLLTAFAANLFLATDPFYRVLLYGQVLFYVMPMLDMLLGKAGLHLSILRFSTHLLSMNLALFYGLIRYLKGVRSSVWEPTKRNQ